MALRKLILSLASLLLLTGAAPSRTQTYTVGEIIDPAEVTENEDNIYTYLQNGVDTYATASITAAAIAALAVDNAELAANAVTTDKILDNTVGVADLAASLAFADGDLINLGSVTVSHTAEGLILPRSTTCTAGTTESQVCWDTNDDFLVIGTSGSTASIGTLGTPNLTFTTSNAAGSATTTLRTDASLAIFDATAASTMESSNAAATGSQAFAARRDHEHGLPGFSWVFVETLTLTGTSVSSSTLPTTTDSFLLILEGAQGDTSLNLRVSGLSGGYDYATLSGAGVANATGQAQVVLNATTTEVSGTIMIARLGSADGAMAMSLSEGGGSLSALPFRANQNSGSAVTSVTFFASGSMSGKVHIYRRGE